MLNDERSPGDSEDMCTGMNLDDGFGILLKIQRHLLEPCEDPDSLARVPSPVGITSPS